MEKTPDRQSVLAGPKVVSSIDCESAVELLDLLDPNYGAFDAKTVYRGHGSDKWMLTPSLFRESRDGLRPGNSWNEFACLGAGSKEIGLLLRFVLEADRRGFEIPGGGADRVLDELRSLYETGWGVSGGGYVDTKLLPALALAQHSGVPTRLLDWTSSAWVAAYFAARDNLREKERPEHLSIWTTRKDEGGSWEMRSIQPFFLNGEELCTARFRVQLSFLPISGSGNPNLRAQSGELMYSSVSFHIDPSTMRKPEYHEVAQQAVEWGSAMNIDGLIQQMIDRHRGKDLRLPNPPFVKLRLRSEQAPTLLRLLDQYGFNGSTIYPGLAGVADSAKERTLYGNYGALEETNEDLLRQQGNRIKLLQKIKASLPREQ